MKIERPTSVQQSAKSKTVASKDKAAAVTAKPIAKHVRTSLRAGYYRSPSW